MKRITRHLPNAITCGNLFMGAVGLTFAFNGQLAYAFYCMICSVVFDFLDGFTARLLKAYSPLGKELDSLADLISFGMLPATMLYIIYVPAAPCPLCAFIPFFVAVFSALRLAKFNIDTRQTTSFIGLATPANALLISGAVIYTYHSPAWEALMTTSWLIPCLTLVLSMLLVSELPMFSLKIKSFTFKENRQRIFFAVCIVALCIAGLCLHWHWSLILLLTMCAYLAVNAIHRII